MKVEERARILKLCEQSSNTLGLIQGDFLSWALRKEKLLKPYDRDLKKMKNVSEKLSEEWHNMSAAQVAAGKVFGSPDRARKFLNTHRDILGKPEKQLLRHFMNRPWFYALFSIKETLGDNLFNITDLDSGESLLFHSPGLAQFEHENIAIFLHLLFDNGACYQAFGPFHYYRGFQPYDFEFLARMLSPQLYHKSGLSSVIANKPAYFLLLDRWSEIPVQVHNQEIVCLCSNSIDMDVFDPEGYGSAFNVDRKDELVRYSLKGSEDPFQTADIYYDGKKQKLFLFAYGRHRYHELVEHLSGTVEVPAEPYWQGTVLMLAAVSEMLGRNIPAMDYEQIFTEQEAPSPEAQKELDKINALLQEINNRHNLGIDAPIQELARIYDVPLETALQMQKMLNELTEDRFQIDLEGGLENFTPPPPEVRQKLQRPLHKSELFTLEYSEEAEAYFTDLLPELMQLQELPSPLSLSGLHRLIETLYYRDWDLDHPTVFTYTAYMLLKMGDELRSVRDYAAEILRIFWQVILPGKDKKYRELFIERYSMYCYGCLLPLGLIELDREIDPPQAVDGDYRIKASAFFREWIRPSSFLRE